MTPAETARVLAVFRVCVGAGAAAAAKGAPRAPREALQSRGLLQPQGPSPMGGAIGGVVLRQYADTHRHLGASVPERPVVERHAVLEGYYLYRKPPDPITPSASL
eukprot:1240459-Rhodomonas_salina.1